MKDLPTTAFWRMRAKYPEFNTVGEVYPSRVLRDRIISGMLDLGFLHQGLIRDWCGLRRRVLCREIPVVLLTSRLLADKCPEARWSDFRYEPLIVEASECSGQVTWEIRRFYEKYGLAPQRIIVRPDMDSLLISVAAGQGVAVGSILSQIDVEQIKPLDTGHRDELLCVWREENETELLRDYTDCLAEVFAQGATPAWEAFHG